MTGGNPVGSSSAVNGNARARRGPGHVSRRGAVTRKRDRVSAEEEAMYEADVQMADAVEDDTDITAVAAASSGTQPPPQASGAIGDLPFNVQLGADDLWIPS